MFKYVLIRAKPCFQKDPQSLALTPRATSHVPRARLQSHTLAPATRNSQPETNIPQASRPKS